VPRSPRTCATWPGGTSPRRGTSSRPSRRPDLASGALPRFSFVRPGSGYSEEPPEDIAEGDAWLGQLVQAVARSRYWKSTAIFLTYDEGGGFWDPVPPVSTGYGTRTPMVIVSPWARRGAYGQPSTTISILSFMQHYRVTAAGPDGSTGWTTVVVLPPHQRPSRATAGFSRTGM
jgi:phospholipase C